MATNKKRSTKKVSETFTSQEVASSKREETIQKPKVNIRTVVILAVIVVALLLWRFKGLYLAAMVNGKPITRFELNDLLASRYGSQTLDGMINERLILDETYKKGVQITSADIDAKAKEIEDRLKGTVSLKEALEAQGMTEAMFRHQIEVQLAVDKYFEKDASVSSGEVDQYIASNSAQFASATDPAELKATVKDILKQQKVNDLFQKWFEDIKQKASVSKYL